ncbi:hypothetical protein B4135_2507 [Caldibacillus debilis]|uniref:Uncharacterized protein n=1 Tax=Caldibacillus debilis TaxID=301148 RepID=A0A150LZ07_9BACI|nr:hypothetical protein B4135_2507 [Caldibacillus debilis]
MKPKNTNKKATIPFFADRSIFLSFLPRQKNNSPKVPADGLETDIKTFFNCTRRFHFLSEFFHINVVIIESFLV